MGLAIAFILIVPIFLYSIGPEGPAKVGDVVFSTDRHRVFFVNRKISREGRYQDFCILESRVQLVIQRLPTSTNGALVGEPVGGEKAQFPYCPSQTPVLIYPHQVTLKADLWGGLRDTIRHLFAGK